jgi:Flp pilus assembly pilin Flp
MDRHWSRAKDWLLAEDGQAMTEYALVVVLVSVALIALLVLLRSDLANVWDGAVTAINAVL